MTTTLPSPTVPCPTKALSGIKTVTVSTSWENMVTKVTVRYVLSSLTQDSPLFLFVSFFIISGGVNICLVLQFYSSYGSFQMYLLLLTFNKRLLVANPGIAFGVPAAPKPINPK